MRQTLLLNIVILGFFVFLFHSLYRRRPSARLKFWIGGWIFAVLHFLVLFWQPASDFWSKAVGAVSLAALLLCGLWFLLSIPVRAPRYHQLVGVTLAALFVAIACSIQFAEHSRQLFLALDLLVQIAGLIFLWRYHNDRMSLKIPGTVLILVCTQWSSYEILKRAPDTAMYVLLMELYATYTLMFAQDFSRRTAGVLTTILGLFVWAAVFPVGVAVSVFWPAFVVDPEIWNVPKVVVAFGMLVTLFEDEQAAAEREREQYRNLFEGNPLAMWIFDPDSMRLLEANAAATRDFGWRRDQLRSLTISDLVSENEPSPVGLIELNWRLAGEEGKTASSPDAEMLPADVTRADAIRFRTRGGEDLIVEATLQRIRFRGQEARLLMAKDITSQVEAHEQLIHLANHDPLTGLPNRLLLQDRMQSALATAARHGNKAALLCIDLDRFKQINDTFGHAAGDTCLREVANRLRQRLRAVDTAARTGGEEFMIILDDVGNFRDAERVADDVLLSLGAPYAVDGVELRLSASIGIALFPDDGTEPATLWRKADTAMYRAKQSGGSRHHFFSRSL